MVSFVRRYLKESAVTTAAQSWIIWNKKFLQMLLV